MYFFKSGLSGVFDDTPGGASVVCGQGEVAVDYAGRNVAKMDVVEILPPGFNQGGQGALVPVDSKQLASKIDAKLQVSHLAAFRKQAPCIGRGSIPGYAPVPGSMKLTRRFFKSPAIVKRTEMDG